MDAMQQQIGRIGRCHRFISRRNSEVGVEVIARLWIQRYAKRWRMRWGDKR